VKLESGNSGTAAGVNIERGGSGKDATEVVRKRKMSAEVVLSHEITNAKKKGTGKKVVRERGIAVRIGCERGTREEGWSRENALGPSLVLKFV